MTSGMKSFCRILNLERRGQKLAGDTEEKRCRSNALHRDLERSGHAVLEFSAESIAWIDGQFDANLTITDFLSYTMDGGGHGAILSPGKTIESKSGSLRGPDAAKCCVGGE